MQVWALPRAIRALRHGINVVDLSRRSLNYEVGFALLFVSVPVIALF